MKDIFIRTLKPSAAGHYDISISSVQINTRYKYSSSIVDPLIVQGKAAKKLFPFEGEN